MTISGRVVPRFPSSSFAVRGALLVAALLVAVCSVAPAQGGAGPVVPVRGGRVQGALLAGQPGAVFKGMPFAAPPVGALRWKEPQAVVPWTGVQPALQYGAPCAQSGYGWEKIAPVRSSEDCLYLNVWAPEWPVKTPKAVIVWLFGGGNAAGSAIGGNGIEPPYDGASLAKHGVVLVTINYRLGVFGFMGHPELTAESPHHASGGYGILDQIAALQWVQDNIAKFGGDPKNVTLMGQSAGARDTTVVMTSPLAKGLLQKAIIESGSPMSNDRHMQTQAQMEENGTVLGQLMKAPAGGEIAYLRGLSTAEIMAAQGAYAGVLRQKGLLLDVGIDGYAATAYAAEVFRTGKEMPVPVLWGSNGRDNPSQRIGEPGDSDEMKRAAAKQAVEAFYGKYPDLLERALTAYGFRGAESQVSTYPPYGTVDIQLGSDIAIRCATTVIVGWHSAVAPVYEYEFDAGTPSHPPVHVSELNYTFGYLADQGSEAKLRMLSDQMQTYWTNFATTSDPNGPGLPKWPKYDNNAKQYLQLSNEGIATKSALRSGTCGIFAARLHRDLDARLK